MKNILKYSLLAISLMTATASQADVVQDQPQSASFSGAAGNDSTEPGVAPFVFAKFDEALGKLTNVFFRTTFTLSGGLIGADNMTNDATSGYGDLGAKLFLSGSEPLLNGSYASLFSPIELTQRTTFTLAADPTLSTGGNGPDVMTYYGTTLQEQTSWRSISTTFLSNYTGAGQTFNINFDTDSSILVSVPGAQGFFQVPNVYLNVEVYYEYEPTTVQPPPSADVNSPVLAMLSGLSLIGLGLSRRRQKK